MLSWRLWRAIAEAEIHDPIFRRVSTVQRPATTRRRPRKPLVVWLLGILAIAFALVMGPQLLALALAVPIGMISLIVAAPVYLPVVIWLAGAYATGEIVSGIYREKHQHTYDLICASTRGQLEASWSFATGLLHRGGYFLPLRWGARASLGCGLLALGGLSFFTLVFALAGQFVFGMEQVRLLLLPLLLLAAYLANLTQTFATSHVVGLLASSFELAKRDAALAGLLGYVLLSGLPLVGAGLVYAAFRGLAGEGLALVVVVAGRELVIVALWRVLGWRMGAGGWRLRLRGDGGGGGFCGVGFSTVYPLLNGKWQKSQYSRVV